MDTASKSDSTRIVPGSYASAAAPEHCFNKVYQFIENVLGVSDAKSKINIVRAHRMPSRPIPGKTRSVVIKFKGTDSKCLVKNASRKVELKGISVRPTKGVDSSHVGSHEERPSSLPGTRQALH